jgi:hypothetical protein
MKKTDPTLLRAMRRGANTTDKTPAQVRFGPLRMDTANVIASFVSEEKLITQLAHELTAI